MAVILIADDEADIREVVREYAEISGYEIDEADDGMKAVEMVQNQHYDCVILDVMMPHLDGFSACRRIMENADCSGLPRRYRLYNVDFRGYSFVQRPGSGSYGASEGYGQGCRSHGLAMCRNSRQHIDQYRSQGRESWITVPRFRLMR